MLGLNLDVSGVIAGVERISRAAKAAVRPAAQAGAEEFYISAKLAAPVSEKSHFFTINGRTYGPFQPGNLRDSIYQAYSKTNSNEELAVYHVSFNKEKAPYGYAVIRGTPYVAANDFIGLAYDRVREVALEASHAVLRDAMKEVL
ncbi:hypothetical protein [Comamonas terrigena]|uniref:hypothetical protein n=1 Tax=Comamonas terrigena TaxID=32013 RepID=UPI0023570447|nr:hypothetical protein [Comamonas terrigena]